MRIIAGQHKGRSLSAPKGMTTRPTSDRTRESLFNILAHAPWAPPLEGARVIDLFAGSGALGLEALSRGAAHATFVEADARAAGVLRGNVKELGAGPRATVAKERVRTFLTREATFDVILADPPYDIPREELAAVLELVASRLAPDGLVMLEWSARAGDAPWPPGLSAVTSKAYGETAIHYAEPALARDDVPAEGGSVDS